MKKVILLFISMFFSLGVVNAQSVEFCTVSNVGLEVDKSTKYADTMTPTIQKLLDAKNQINKNGCGFTLFLGDNLKGPDKYNLVMFAKILRQFKKPTYVNVGDKDVSQTKNLDK